MKQFNKIRHGDWCKWDDVEKLIEGLKTDIKRFKSILDANMNDEFKDKVHIRKVCEGRMYEIDTLLKKIGAEE
jgi:hypothetical protein